MFQVKTLSYHIQRFYFFLGFLLSQIEVSNFVLECCEEIEIAPSSPTDIFTNFNGFGIGTYKKDGIDARGRMIYRNSEHDFHVYGLGDFILMYEEPNEGGRQNWKVRMHLNMLCMHCRYMAPLRLITINR